MKLTKRQAKALSIKKWEFIVKNGGDPHLKRLPIEVRDLRAHCGYCEKYFTLHGASSVRSVCGKCPLVKNEDLNAIDSGCVQPGHPYAIWASSSTKENAQAVLDLIRKS